MKLNNLGKSEIATILGLNALAVKETDKELFDMMAYTSKSLEKDEKAVTKKDLLDLLKDVQKALGDKFVSEPQKEVVETSVKKPVKKSKKAEPVKEEEQEDDGLFPKEMTWGKEKYKQLPLKSMEELYQALSEDKEVFIAFHWTKNQLKRTPYFDGMLGQPKEFEMNLDLSTIIYISEEKKVAYALSLTTEAAYNLLPMDFTVENEGDYKEAGGFEFEFYTKK